jgi:hypothetical protein
VTSDFEAQTKEIQTIILNAQKTLMDGVSKLHIDQNRYNRICDDVAHLVMVEDTLKPARQHSQAQFIQAPPRFTLRNSHPTRTEQPFENVPNQVIFTASNQLRWRTCRQLLQLQQLSKSDSFVEINIIMSSRPITLEDYLSNRRTAGRKHAQRPLHFKDEPSAGLSQMHGQMPAPASDPIFYGER